jgi:hypothetical protein
MASVYLANDQVLERKVALKVIHPHLAKDKSFVEKLGYTRNSDVEELRKRVEELENQANKASKKAAATTSAQ